MSGAHTEIRQLIVRTLEQHVLRAIEPTEGDRPLRDDERALYEALETFFDEQAERPVFEREAFENDLAAILSEHLPIIGQGVVPECITEDAVLQSVGEQAQAAWTEALSELVDEFALAYVPAQTALIGESTARWVSNSQQAQAFNADRAKAITITEANAVKSAAVTLLAALYNAVVESDDA